MQDLLNENPRLVTPFGADGSLTAAYVSSFWILVGVGVVGLPQMAVRAMSYKSSPIHAPRTRHRHDRHRIHHAQHALNRHFRTTRLARNRGRGQSHSAYSHSKYYPHGWPASSSPHPWRPSCRQSMHYCYSSARQS